MTIHIEIEGYSSSFRPNWHKWKSNWEYTFVFSSSAGGTSDLSQYRAEVLKNEDLRIILGL